MGNRSKQEYLQAICERSRHSSKKQKQAILDKFVTSAGTTASE
jgi:hypothetical protein